MPRLVVIASVLASEGALLLTALWLAGAEPLGLALTPTLVDSGIGLVAGGAVSAAIWRVMVAPRAWQQRFRHDLIVVGRLIASRLTVVDIVFISMAAGLGEELLFRAALMDGLSTRLDPWSALLLTSALFGLLHPVSPVYIAYAAGVGAVLGILTMAVGGVWAAVVAHAVIDCVGLWLVRQSAAGLSEPP